MYKPKKEIQNEAEFVFIDDLVPQDHSKPGKVLYKFRKEKVERSSQIQKNCTGFAIVGYVDCIMRVSKYYLPQHAKI